MKDYESLIGQVLDESQKIIIGKEKQIKLSLATFLSGSHLLIEDIPGVGKTTLAKTISHVMGLEYSRIQFTNDLLPSDIIGVNFYNTKESTFSFKKGPVFSQFLLADEINRASSKTQSALLEAMEEQQVSIDGESFDLPRPFFVIATKNPYEEIGTYMLPSSQLDRFAISFSLGYPSFDAEREILSSKNRYRIDDLKSLNMQEIELLQNKFEEMYANEEILDIIQEILKFTRESSLYVKGLSTRAAITLLKISKAWAMISLRDYVLPSDVLEVLPYITHHRLESKGDKKSPVEIVDEIIKNLHIDI
ncbi:AAA domain-containing protein [Sulfurimonas aquatica]|uniref:AAA domain-containing protein n=1 Tax=Sulfurimonas aquatica TaxID=2672570 RepID=A0A975AYX8_9BACT|nr:AAA family ATPase [Sulfurimonas aquatica]QSZ41065.1 AAA domain-containing protein [Sulfurimonas aquatica]